MQHLEITILQIILQFDQYAYFVDHASSKLDILIGTINFIVVFFIIPCAIQVLVIYALIRIGIMLYKHTNKHNINNDDTKE